MYISRSDEYVTCQGPRELLEVVHRTRWPAERNQTRQRISSAGIAASVVAVFLASCAHVRGEVVIADKAAKIDVGGLAIDWRNEWSRSVAVSGSVRCYNEDYCEFVSPRYVRRIIPIDITMLSVESRRHIVFDCHTVPCPIVVIGRVTDDDVLAKEIHDVAE